MATRTAGLTWLGALAEVVGQYAAARNYADGLTTTRLSPYLRRRLVLEEEVLGFAGTTTRFRRPTAIASPRYFRRQHSPRGRDFRVLLDGVLG